MFFNLLGFIKYKVHGSIILVRVFGYIVVSGSCIILI